MYVGSFSHTLRYNPAYFCNQWSSPLLAIRNNAGFRHLYIGFTFLFPEALSTFCTLYVTSFVFVVLSFRSSCLGAHLVLTTVKVFEMSRLQAKLYLFSVHVVLYIHLCSKSSLCHQPDRERGRDRQREKKKRGGVSLEASTSATLSVALTLCSIRTGCLTCCDWWLQLWTRPWMGEAG